MQAIAELLARLAALTSPDERANAITEALTGENAPTAADLQTWVTKALESGDEVDDAVLEAFDAVSDAVEQRMDAADARADRLGKARERLDSITNRGQNPDTDATTDGEDEPDEAAVVAEAEKITADAPEPAAAGAGAELAVRPQRPTVPLGHQRGTPPAAQTESGALESFELVAAAEVPGFSSGQNLGDLNDFGRAWESRMMPVITSGSGQGRQRVGIARIKRTLPEEFTISSGKGDEVERVLEHATNERRLEGGSLTAAGGWCAPSERLYDLCPLRITQEGMISLPQITARRGGIEYQADFDWAAIWGSIGFYQTEAEAIAGTEKTCNEVPCSPDPVECRMDVSGVCLRTPILAERGYPERIRAFTEGALAIHAHQMNARKLAKMEALSTKVTIPGPAAPDPAAAIADPHGPGAVESLLSILELQVQYQRYRDRLSQNATLELVAPYWLRGILKSDLRKKLGIDNRWSVSDAILDTYLRNAGVNPQWVYDWQDAYADGKDTGFGGAAAPTAWPTQVKVLLFPAGTFFQLTADVITLDGVHDHASLIQNMYTSLFTEEGWQVCSRCGTSYVVTIDLCANGLSGSHQSTTCATAA